jgi:Flp pilus assembly protein TadD
MANVGGASGGKRSGGWVPKILLLVIVLLGAIGGALWFLRTRSVPYRLSRLQDEARLQSRVGKPEEAVKLLEEAVKLGPDIAGLAVQLAAALDATGRPADAEKALRDALARMPRNLAVTSALAARLAASGRAKEGLALLEPLVDRIRAVTDAGERGRTLLVLGQAAARAGEVDRAHGYLDEAAAVDAVKVQALGALGQALLGASRLEAAEKAFRDAAAADPADLAAAVGLARVLEQSGRASDAISALDAFRKGASERRLEAAVALGDLYVRLGRAGDARALAEEVGRDPSGAAASSYIRGAAALADGDLASAEAAFTRMAELIPRSAHPRILAAQAALRRGAPERARQLLAAAIEVEPGRSDAELALLDLDARAGDAAAVRARAERLLEDEQTRPRALRALLSTYTREGDAAGGLARLVALRARYPQDAALRLNEAVFRILAGDAEKGVADLAKLAEEDPDLPGAFALLAGAEETSADTMEAIDRLATLAAKDPRFARARLALAQVYDRLGRRDLARREVDAALAERPDLREARAVRARLAAADGDWAAAIADLEKLEAADPKDVQVLVQLAQLSERAGDAAGAVRRLEKACELAPRSAPAQALLGRALARAGDPQRALAAFEKARALDARLPAAHEDAALLLAQGDLGGAASALVRALEATRDPRFSAALAATRAISGQAAQALEPMSAWRARAGGSPEGAIAHAMVLGLAGEAGRARASAQSAAAPPEVRAAAAAVAPAAAGAVSPRDRFCLEVFALAVLGAGPELRERAETVGREPGADALILWWAQRGLAASGRPAPELRTALARKLAAAAPTDPGPSLEVADALIAGGDPGAELAALEALRERFPEHPLVALRLGMALERGGRIDDAVAQYTRAAAAPDASPAALNNLAYHLAKDPSRRAAAIDLAQRAARAAPRAGQILDTLGWLLLLDGQVEEAAAVLARAVAAAPSIATIRYHFALALDERGETDRAAGQLEAAALSRGDFPERAEAEALLARWKGELLGAREELEAAKPLAPGAALEETLAPGSRAVFKIAAGEAGREARLALRAPKEGPATARVLSGGKPYARLTARAGEEASIRRLALEPGGHVVVVRSEEGAGGTFRIALEAAAAPGGDPWEREPNGRAADAGSLAAGGTLSGAFDDVSDKDCVRLDIPAGGRARALLGAGPAGDVRAELLVVTGALERPVRLLRVPAGGEVALEDLAPSARGALALRLGTTGGSGRGAAAAPFDWRVRLLPAEAASAGDVEPNDRDDDARPLAQGAAPVAGRLGAGDDTDWYRVEAAEGDLVAISLKDTSAGRAAGAPSPVALELWERAGDRRTALRRYFLPSGEVSVARWRAPREGALHAAVVLTPGGRANAAYELRCEKAAAPEALSETEPNDRPALADSAPLGAAIAGALDVAQDRDWFRVPPPARGEMLTVSLEAEEGFAGAVVSVFADPDREPRLLASFDASGGSLLVPAMRVPDGLLAAVVAAAPGARAPGAYRLTLSTTRVGAGGEVEPNDDAANAAALAGGATVRGRLSGLADRDIYRVPGRATVRIRASGKAPVAVQPRTEGAARRTIEPGAEVVLGPEALGAGDAALLELLVPRPEVATAAAETLARARAAALYELSVEAAR